MPVLLGHWFTCSQLDCKKKNQPLPTVLVLRLGDSRNIHRMISGWKLEVA